MCLSPHKYPGHWVGGCWEEDRVHLFDNNNDHSIAIYPAEERLLSSPFVLLQRFTHSLLISYIWWSATLPTTGQANHNIHYGWRVTREGHHQITFYQSALCVWQRSKTISMFCELCPNSIKKWLQEYNISYSNNLFMYSFQSQTNQ